jgi:MHS family proline/betaine transporter-like MFS transporter
LTSAGRLGERQSLQLSTVAALAVILVSPLTGVIADKIGRKSVLLFLCVCSGVLPIALFKLMARGTERDALLGAVVLACVAGAVSAIGAIATAEQFPGGCRISGLALGATSATVLFGGVSPYIAQVLTQRTGWALAPGAMIAGVALCVLPILLSLPETAPGRKIHSAE